jgi:type IV pilus assembly protein PilO
MNKLYDFFANMSSQKMLIIAGLLGGIYYMTIFDDGSALETQLNQIKSEIAVEAEKVTRSEQAKKEVEEVRMQVGALGEQFKIVAQKIPPEVQMADVIRLVDGVAKSAGVSIKSKEPLPRLSKDYFEEIPLKITLEGSFSEITMYLFYISSLERIMRVRDFRLDIPPGNSSQNSMNSFGGLLRFEGEILSYRFLGDTSSTEKKK